MTAAPAGAKCLHRCNVNYTRQSTTEANCRDVRLSARILNRSHRPMEEGAQNEHPRVACPPLRRSATGSAPGA
jgi:hypothetical protein